VIDSQSAARMEFWGAIGHHNTPDFIANDFLKAQPQYEWMRGLLRDMKSRPWSRFSTGMTRAATKS